MSSVNALTVGLIPVWIACMIVHRTGRMSRMREDWDGTEWELPDTRRCGNCEALIDNGSFCNDCEGE